MVDATRRTSVAPQGAAAQFQPQLLQPLLLNQPLLLLLQLQLLRLLPSQLQLQHQRLLLKLQKKHEKVIR